MKAYADSSFILGLITAEADSAAVIGEYRRLGLPALFFLSLHALEVRNAILQRAFHKRRSLPARQRRGIARERDTALHRLERLRARRTLLDVALDMDEVAARAIDLANAHTERLGARAIDLLHVAGALVLNSGVFLTTDHRQAGLARAEGLRVVAVTKNS